MLRSFVRLLLFKKVNDEGFKTFRIFRLEKIKIEKYYNQL